MCQLARPNCIASSLACVSFIVVQVLSSAISSGVCACCRGIDCLIPLSLFIK